MTEEERRYRDNEIDLMHEKLQKELKHRHSELLNYLEEIKKQTEYTNGKVADQEQRIRENEKWRFRITGGLLLITGVVVPISIAVIQIYL